MLNRIVTTFLCANCLTVAVHAQCSSQWVLGRQFGSPGPASYHTLAYDTERDVHVFFRFAQSNPINYAALWEWRGPRDLTPGYGNSPSPSWPYGRIGGRMAFDEARSRTVLFGGEPPGSTGIGTWEWAGTSFGGGSWTSLIAIPGVNRSFFAMGYDPVSERVILHGGRGDAGQTLSSTYAWNGAAWTLLSAGSPSVARSHTQMVYYPPRGTMVMFGGLNAQGQTTSDLLEWTGAAWSPVPQQNVPYARQGNAFVYEPVRERLMVIGGFGNANVCTVDDVWEFDGATWVRIGDTPMSCRANANAVWDEEYQQVVLYNGVSVWVQAGGRPLVMSTSWRNPVWPTPTGQWLRPGEVLELTEVVSDGPVSYQWQVEESGVWRDVADGPLSHAGNVVANVVGARSSSLSFPTVFRSSTADEADVPLRCIVANACGMTVVSPPPMTTGHCNDIDFNNDDFLPDTLDIAAYISVFSGGPCLHHDWQGPACDGLDFNNDGLFPDVLDVHSLISVFSGGPCL